MERAVTEELINKRACYAVAKEFQIPHVTLRRYCLKHGKENNDGNNKQSKRCRHSTLTDECATFVFPENSEKAKFTHSIKDVVIKLPNPMNRKGTKRCQQKYVFDVNLTSYNPQ